jgi:hypothetical protein
MITIILRQLGFDVPGMRGVCFAVLFKSLVYTGIFDSSSFFCAPVAATPISPIPAAAAMKFLRVNKFFCFFDKQEDCSSFELGRSFIIIALLPDVYKH